MESPGFRQEEEISLLGLWITVERRGLLRQASRLLLLVVLTQVAAHMEFVLLSFLAFASSAPTQVSCQAGAGDHLFLPRPSVLPGLSQAILPLAKG